MADEPLPPTPVRVDTLDPPDLLDVLDALATIGERDPALALVLDAIRIDARATRVAVEEARNVVGDLAEQIEPLLGALGTGSPFGMLGALAKLG